MSDQQRVALVTGASRGIGHAIAQRLAAQGHQVVGTATSDSGAQSLSEELAPVGGFGLRLDISDTDSISAAIDTIESRLGAPLILVNNAGITRDNLMMRMKDAEWDEAIDTNLTGLYRVTKRCLRGMMKARWGRVINLSSVVAATGNAGQANYAAAKAGIQGYTRSLAREIGSRGITVNAVAPGFIDTDMTRSLSAEQHRELTQQIPLGTLGRPEHVAAMTAFLASDDGEYITGQTLHVNGGMYVT